MELGITHQSYLWILPPTGKPDHKQYLGLSWSIPYLYECINGRIEFLINRWVANLD
jgi:hypothetical protein